MHESTAPAVAAKVGASNELRRSERERSATARFVQGWFALHLPLLSLALGIGAIVQGRRNDHATKITTTTEGELPPNDNIDIPCAAALGFEACDEAPALGFPDEEGQALARIGGMEELRRSERERRATRRFEEGWFGEWLPRLSSALGVAVTDGRVQ